MPFTERGPIATVEQIVRMLLRNKKVVASTKENQARIALTRQIGVDCAKNAKCFVFERSVDELAHYSNAEEFTKTVDPDEIAFPFPSMLLQVTNGGVIAPIYELLIALEETPGNTHESEVLAIMVSTRARQFWVYTYVEAVDNINLIPLAWTYTSDMPGDNKRHSATIQYIGGVCAELLESLENRPLIKRKNTKQCSHPRGGTRNNKKKKKVKFTKPWIYMVGKSKGSPTWSPRDTDVEMVWQARWRVRGHWREHNGMGKNAHGIYIEHGRTWVVPHEKGDASLPMVEKIRILK